LTTSNKRNKTNQKEEKYDIEFFKKEYGKRNMICDGTKCNAIENCVMHPWRKEGPALVQGLAEITVKSNQEITELFKKLNAGQLPKGVPVFKLVMYHCPSHKAVPIDFGD